jgi:hypothetical protein
MPWWPTDAETCRHRAIIQCCSFNNGIDDAQRSANSLRADSTVWNFCGE